jgi:hypothetical protein
VDKSTSSAWTVSQAAENQTTTFPIITKGQEDYTPNRLITLDITEGSTAINPVIIINRDAAVFATGGPFALHGKIKTSLTGAASGAIGGNLPNLSIDSLINYSNTEGWVSILDAAGNPFTFTAGGYFTFVAWWATGSISLADIYITNAVGDTVYSMETDANFDTTHFVGDGPFTIWYPAHYGAGGAYTFKIESNPAPVTHTPDDYAKPQFTAQTGLTQEIIDNFLAGDSGSEGGGDQTPPGSETETNPGDGNEDSGGDGAGGSGSGNGGSGNTVTGKAVPLFTLSLLALLSAGAIVFTLRRKRAC